MQTSTQASAKLFFGTIVQSQAVVPPTAQSTLQLANVCTNPVIIQAVRDQLKSALSVTIVRGIFGSLPPHLTPSKDVQDFWEAYLDEIQGTNSEGSKMEEEWGLWELCFRSWKALHSVFQSSEGGRYAVLFSRLTYKLYLSSTRLSTPHLIHLAIQQYFQPIRDALSLSSRDPSPSVPSKKQALFPLAEILFRVYARLDTHKLGAQILQVVRPSLGLLEKEGWVERAVKVRFEQAQGTWLLGDRRIPQAHTSLHRAFLSCPSNTLAMFHNRRLILVSLLTTSILLGTLPTGKLLDHFQLTDQFGPLVCGIRYGDLRSWRRGLGETGGNERVDRMEWFRRKKVLGVLREKGVILVWRSLLRRTLLIYRSCLQQPSSGQSDRVALPLSFFLTALRFGTEDDSLDIDDAECIVCNLISLGYVKAVILRGTQMVVFSKETGMGFPPISRVPLRTV
ncbi:Transcription-associated recombination protein-Thp1p [Phaffia rhodozyma]|uniref:Transcription-associated recombination protein-Thp1p n=1 Tax=Phaffia rhodozyma TaxID=264483 RepID=A0A0F7SRQ9_PHARH|nr:Transcription-associated recombination protein-Thp1p [Phaffia rhodozyma]